jgi:hypothetical protein
VDFWGKLNQNFRTSINGKAPKIPMGTPKYLVGVFNPSEKYESPLGVLVPIYGK